MSYGSLMAFIRMNFPASTLTKNGSILKRLMLRYSEDEVEAMVRGAKLLGFDDLRIVYGQAGEGRRNAMSAFYRSQQRKSVPLPKTIKDILRQMAQ